VRAALLVAGKDLRQRLRDRSALLVAFVIPFALAAVFGLTLSGTGDVTFRFGLVQLDDGESASFFRREVLAGLEREDLARVRRATTVAEGGRLVDEGAVDATFVVPRGFSAAVARGERARLEVVGDPDRPIGTLVARSIAQSYASGLDAVRVAVAADLRAGERSLPPAELGRRAAALATPVVIDDVTAERKELDVNTFYAAGMAVFFLFFAVQFGVSTLLDERRQGTLARLLAAPIRRGAILGGKALTSVVLGVMSMGALAVATSLLLEAHWGNPLGVALLIVAGVIAATALTALVATFARTPDQAGYWQSIVAVVLGMLGGCFFPVYQAGGWLELVSLGTPHAWFLRGLGELAGDAPPEAAVGPAAAIFAFAAIAGALAVRRVGRLVER
jgi:ABC-2 type transport system permease protein